MNISDTITWTVATGEFHTVTFLSGAAPPPLIAIGPNGPDINPAAGFPSRTLPGIDTYPGSGIFNSGLLNEGDKYTLGFGEA